MPRTNIILPEGWIAFFNIKTKVVVGIQHFPKGGKAFTDLGYATAASKEDLIAHFEENGLIYTPPPEAPQS